MGKISFEQILDTLKNYDGEEIRIMEVCGTHTAAISENGIPSMLSQKIKLISGPGCPVCVTVTAVIDKLVELSMKEDTIVLTFGDLIRVKGTSKSLADAKAEGGHVKMVYSPMETVKLAMNDPDHTYVFAAIGFETTTPVYAMVLEEAIKNDVNNLKLLTSLKTMPEVIRWVVKNGGDLDGFIAPGHVATITGSDEYKELSEKDNTETAKFTTVTFDSTSAKDTAVKPAGFSGSGPSSSGYTNSDSQVTGVISENNFKYTDTNGKTTLGIYEEKKGTDESGNETTEKVIKEGSALSASEIFTSQGMEDGATVGHYVLIINNRDASYYTYQSSSLTLDNESYYQFTAYVRTAYLNKDNTAKAIVTVDDQTYTLPVNTSTYANDGAETLGGWKKVTFYLKNEKTSSVSGAYFKFTLGENTDDGKIQGYYLIDNVSMSKISEDEYNTATAAYNDFEKDETGEVRKDENGNEIQTEANKQFRLSNSVIVLEKDEETSDDSGDDNGDDSGDGKKLNTTLLWTYITSIAIAAVLIAVIVVWLIRKYAPKKGASAPVKSKASYDRNAKRKDEEVSDSKSGSARDEFKD